MPKFQITTEIVITNVRVIEAECKEEAINLITDYDQIIDDHISDEEVVLVEEIN